MANIISRIRSSIEADLHDALDRKEHKNPVAVLNQYLRQCEQETEKARKLLERQYTLKDEFTREYKHAKQFAEKRKRQAEIASQADEKELYDFAVQEQAQYEERAYRLNNLLTEATQQVDVLERKYEEMKHKVKDMHIRRMELMGRENITRAHHRMNKVINSNDATNSPFTKFEEIDNYLDRLEHDMNSSYFRNTIDARIAQLEKEAKKEVN
ncbi:PspA/IM30 family protein [Cytobacillus sp. Hm23]|uniref:PspA/IM30 family protein n=1 Tax=Cytobacillus sp. IB215665 TaxID=3097357 RepID=UPI002A16037E|nr:PspA/IM30 family protein [Cytobacillus sp. IB215665]MDX8367235.1 PspA/IM30 family protein [Cytobacillus sp. IB215665]